MLSSLANDNRLGRLAVYPLFPDRKAPRGIRFDALTPRIYLRHSRCIERRRLCKGRTARSANMRPADGRYYHGHRHEYVLGTAR